MTLQKIEIDGHLACGRMTFAAFGENFDSQENEMQYFKAEIFQYNPSLQIVPIHKPPGEFHWVILLFVVAVRLLACNFLSQ